MNFGLFIIILFLVAIVMRVDFFFYMLYFFFAVHLFSRIWVRRAINQVSVEREMDRCAFWGERMQVQLRIRNNGLLPVPWLQIQESLPQPLAFPPVRSQALSLWPKETRLFAYELDCRQRGYYTIGPMRLVGGDLLGSGSQVAAEKEVCYLTVYPRILLLEELGIPSQSPYGNIRRSTAIHRDPARTAGVRDYSPGDSFRHIHWKSTASQGKLQTKVFDPIISLDTAVFLDLEREHYEQSHAVTTTEMAISVAASVIADLARRAQAFSLAANGVDPLAGDEQRGPVVPMGSGQAHLMATLAALGRIQTRGSESFSALLQRQILSLPWGCTVVLISGNGQDLLGHVLQLRKTGFRVMVVLADYHSNLRGTGEELQNAGATVYRLRRSLDLKRLAV